MVLLYDPSAARARARGNGVTLDTLAGKVVGFIDNAKPNFDHLVDELGRLLVAEYGVARVVKRRKPSASVPAEPQVVAALAAECDLVIAGSGD